MSTEPELAARYQRPERDEPQKGPRPVCPSEMPNSEAGLNLNSRYYLNISLSKFGSLRYMWIYRSTGEVYSLQEVRRQIERPLLTVLHTIDPEYGVAGVDNRASEHHTRMLTELVFALKQSLWTRREIDRDPNACGNPSASL